MESKVVLSFIFGGNLLILALLSAYKKKDSDAAIHYHFKAQLMLALSYPFAFARLYSSFRIFAVLNTSAMMVGIFFEALALADLADILTTKMKRNLGAILYCGLAAYVFSAVAIDLVQVRIVVFSLVTFVLIVYPSLRVLRTKNGSLLRSLLGALFLFMVAATVVRIIDAIRIGPTLVLFGPSLGESLTLVSFYVYLILGGAGIILLDKEKTDARLLRLSKYDGMTGALNRDGFIAAVTSAVEKCSYDNLAFSMLLVDIDGLDEINDSNGFAAGDRIIAATAERLLAGVGGSGFVGRLSGDEFMVFLSAVDSRRIDEEMARLRNAVVVDPPGGIPYTVSSGAAAFDFPAGRDISFPRMYADCGLALKKAKEKGPGSGFVAPA